MKVSSQEEYGLRCLVQLARHDAKTPLPISEISAREGLSIEYVGKLLMKLRRGGLADSIRGKSGGYVMARPADEVTLRDVLEVLSEPIYEPSHCTKFSGTEEVCVHAASCGIRPVWAVVNRFLAEALDRVRLSQLLEGEANSEALLLRCLADQARLQESEAAIAAASGPTR